MRVVLFITFVFFVELAYGQSKKEQIEILNYRIDSLNRVMDVENNNFNINKSQFEIQISNIRNQIMFLDSNLIILKQELSNKQNELYSSKISIGDKSMEIKLLEENIIEKQGSIDLLNSEIENLKSTLALQNPTEISEDVSLLNQNNTVSIKSEIWEKTDNYELSRLMGPEGCDATSLFKDSKGTLWLGTGSSGGVYKFDNQNKVWIETNNGIGPVHVSQIIEVDNILVIEFITGGEKRVNDVIKNQVNRENKNDSEYCYYDGNEWKKVDQSQIGLIQSQIQNRIEKKIKNLIEFEIKNHEKLLEIKLDYKFLHSIELIDNVLYLLDKRGLFYVNNTDNIIRKFNTKGLNASDIYQIIPNEKEKLFVWTNAFQLWELSKGEWKMQGDLKYDFSLPVVNLPTFKIFLDYGIDDGRRTRGPYSNLFGFEHSSFMSNGYLTYSKERFLLCILGEVYELDLDKKQFKKKLSARFFNSHEDESSLTSSDKEYILVGGRHDKCNIKEALYDIDGSLVFTLESEYRSTNYDYPVRKVSSTYTPYEEVQLTNHPQIVLNQEGRVYGYKSDFLQKENNDYGSEEESENSNKLEVENTEKHFPQSKNFFPLSLSIGSSKDIILNDAFAFGLLIKINNSNGELYNRFSTLSLARNNLQISDATMLIGCGRNDYVFHEYYIIEPLKSVNTRFTCFYDDKKGNIYIGTAGSGLLKVQY